MSYLPQEQAPMNDPVALAEWLTRTVMLINGAFDELRLDSMHFRPNYVEGQLSYPQDVVSINGFLMCCNTETTESASPSLASDPVYVFGNLNIGTRNVVSNQVLTGQRYVFQYASYVPTYSIRVREGYHYLVYAVIDPLGTPVSKVLNDFTATETTTMEINIENTLIEANTTFDFFAIQTEPSTSPVETTISYDYSTPNNPGTPGDGEMIQAGKELGFINIDKDAGGFIDTLVIGDLISRNEITWYIQAISDEGTYIRVAVVPAEQSTPDGVTDVVFESVPDTDITYYQRTGYWAGNTQIYGLRSTRGEYDGIVPDDNQYLLDIKFSKVTKSDHWDVISSPTGGTSGGATSKPYHQVQIPPTAVDENDPETILQEIDVSSYENGSWRFGWDLAWYISESGGDKHQAIFTFYSVDAGVSTVLFTYVREPKDLDERDWVSKGSPVVLDGSYDSLRLTVQESDGPQNPTLVVQNGYMWMQKL